MKKHRFIFNYKKEGSVKYLISYIDNNNIKHVKYYKIILVYKLEHGSNIYAQILSHNDQKLTINIEFKEMLIEAEDSILLLLNKKIKYENYKFNILYINIVMKTYKI